MSTLITCIVELASQQLWLVELQSEIWGRPEPSH